MQNRLFCSAMVAFHAIGLALPPDSPGQVELRRALATARLSENERDRFHAQYKLGGGGRVESIEIVTPYRRAVQIAEMWLASGVPLATDDQLRAELARSERGLLVRAVVALKPLDTRLRPPPLAIVLITTTGDQIQATSVERIALGPRGIAIPPLAIGGGVSMTAVRIDARFPTIAGANGSVRVGILDPDGREMLVRPLPTSLP